MKIRGISFSLSPLFASKEQWREALLSELERALSEGADVVVFPELNYLGLAEFYPGDQKAQMLAVAEEVSMTLLPEATKIIAKRDVLICLGSGPRLVGQELRNSASIFVTGQWHFQDKIHLTPWETDFCPGNELRIHRFRGLKIATLICYDVEQPSLASALKDAGIHLLLVPSATADWKGNQRVLRCASSRAVELGAAVIAVPLIGKSRCDLVDFSEGRQGFFLPSQSLVAGQQEIYSPYTADLGLHQDYTVSPSLLLDLKADTEETKPYLKREKPVKMIESIS